LHKRSKTKKPSKGDRGSRNANGKPMVNTAHARTSKAKSTVLKAAAFILADKVPFSSTVNLH